MFGLSHTALSIIIAICSFSLIAIDKYPKYIIAIIGGALTLSLGIIPLKDSFSYIEFDVIILLSSMMLIVDICSKSGLFSLSAIKILKRTKGDPALIFFSLAIIAGLASTFLDNVATTILLLQVTFMISQKLNINPFPFLMVEVFAANIGGAATLIGDPPNLIIGHEANLNFMDFVYNLAPIITVIFVTCITTLYFIFRKELKSDTPKTALNLSEKNIVRGKFRFYRSIFTLIALIIGFFSANHFGITAAQVALSGAIFLLLFEKPTALIKHIDWQTILFFVGLFLIVGGLQASGTLEALSNKLESLTKDNLRETSMIIIWGSGLISGFIDNIPYTATIAPMISDLGRTMAVEPLWWSLSLGACLGGNLTAIAASGNVIAVHAAHVQGCEISFMRFLKYGALVTFISLSISSVYIWIRYL